MKVLLYSEGMKLIAKSGVGRAIKHQMQALELNETTFTTNKKESDYDIVHINTVGPQSVLLAKNARRRGKKVIMHAHSTQEDFRDSFFFSNWIAPLFKVWIKYAYRHGDELITPTPYSKKLLETYEMDRPIHAVSNGIDLQAFSKDEALGEAFRKEYGFKEDDHLILSVGLQIKRKGILDFIEIAKQEPDYQFIWCGYTAPALLSPEITDAMKSAPDNVHFLGYVTNMKGAYSASDIFFMPTYEETEGIVVLEALAAELTVVIRDIPVYDDWLEHGINCFKANDNESFIDIFEKLRLGELQDTTEEGLKVVEERTLAKVGARLVSIYRRLNTTR